MALMSHIIVLFLFCKFFNGFVECFIDSFIVLLCFYSYYAMYSYKPQKLDELELKKGELYSVSEKCHDGWYKGVSVRSGASGVFPGNYVQLAKYAFNRLIQ